MSVKLDNIEADEMRRFYESELEKTLLRLDHIKKVLGQLGGSSVQVSVHQEGANVPVSAPPKTTKRKGGRSKKRGPKPVWENLVLKRLKQINRPLSYDQLTQEVMEFANIGKDKEKNTKQAVVNVTFKLRNQKGKIDTFSNGGRMKYIALTEWFDDDGEIRDEYRAKVS